jgi:hypothetical protein
LPEILLEALKPPEFLSKSIFRRCVDLSFQKQQAFERDSGIFSADDAPRRLNESEKANFNLVNHA